MFFIQMCGFPGSGKSTLALKIANRTGCIIVDHDVSKSTLIQSNEQLASDVKAAGKLAYDIDFAFVEFYLAQGRSVILDSPCLYEEIIERGTELAQKYHVKYKFIECLVEDVDEINKRLENRESKVSQIKSVQSQEMLSQAIQQHKKPTKHEYLSVKCDGPLDAYMAEVLTYIRK